jgi:hypothetical protein
MTLEKLKQCKENGRLLVYRTEWSDYRMLAMADIVVAFCDDVFRVVKNRYGDRGIVMDIEIVEWLKGCLK